MLSDWSKDDQGKAIIARIVATSEELGTFQLFDKAREQRPFHFQVLYQFSLTSHALVR